MFRVLFCNPDGMGMDANGRKTNSIKGIISKYQPDVMSLEETNVDWSEVEPKDTVWGRFKKEFAPCKIVAAYNTTSSSRHVRSQAGGTTMLTFNKLSLCARTKGVDSRHLGRWSWMKFDGQNGVSTRVINVYLPCYNIKDEYSTYMQQRDRLRSIKINECPRKVFWDDLLCDVKMWIENGEQIILGGDWNTPIGDVIDKLKPIGLQEIITKKHGLDKAPATTKRGSVPIDGIFATASIRPKSCGYLPFNKGLVTDHRILWVDIPLINVIGFHIDQLPLPNPRRLKLDDPRVLDRYYTLLHDHFLRHKVYEKSASLQRRAVFPLPPKLAYEFEKLDKIRTEGMIYAESKCRKLHMGHYKWSPAFKRAFKLIVLWTLVKERHTGLIKNTRWILQLMKAYDVTVREYTLDEALANLDAAKQHYETVKTESAAIRYSYLEGLAQAIAERDGTSAASVLKSLIHREEQRDISIAIKYVTKKLFGEGTSKVLVPDADGKMVEITTKEQLERAIIIENIRKYHATEKYCPLLKGELLEAIGLLGEGPAVQSILDGTFIPPKDTSPATVAFLKHMKRPNLSAQALAAAGFSSVDELSKRWKLKKARTSSCGPLHVAHFKAGFKHPEIRQVHYRFAEICFTSGYNLQRHKTGIDCMLMKDSDDYRISRLRTICLFDAEFNMNNGRVGYNGINSALLSNQIAPEQYSRPGRSAIDHVLNRRLSFEYFALAKKAFSMCSCDLKGNYDRIVHSAASLALQRLGVPLPRVQGMFNTIQQLVKRVRTAFGDSTMEYGGSMIEAPYAHPPQGVYQGNAIGPPVWTIVSSTVFAVLRSEGFGVKFISAISKEVFHLCGFAYVDDSDLIECGDNPFGVAAQLQKALHWWEEIMKCAGQAMAPEKSWWYLVDFTWKKGKWTFDSTGRCLDLIAHDEYGTPTSLTRLVHSQAIKMLGVFLSPDGNHDAEREYLLNKAREWGDCIRSGHLGYLATRIALTSCIWKTIEYPLVVTTFSSVDLQSVTWPLISAALPKMGINRNISADLRYGSASLGGLGLRDLKMVQGLKKLEYFMEHPWKLTPTGKLLIKNIEGLILECGIFGNMFEYNPININYISFRETWVMYLWQFLHHFKIELKQHHFAWLEPQREHDVSLMERFMAHYPDPISLRKLNSCRLYLQVCGISDITDASGKRLDSRALCAKGLPPSGGFRRNLFVWPKQPCPEMDAWKLWNTALHMCFCDGQGPLRCPLNDWISTNDDYPYHTWDYFISADHSSQLPNKLWKHDGSKWYYSKPFRRSTRRNTTFGSRREWTSIRDEHPWSDIFFTRVTVAQNGMGKSITSQSTYSISSPPPPPCFPCTFDGFCDALRSIPEFSWINLDAFVLYGSFDDILQAWCDGWALSVTDGSFYPTLSLGAAAITFETPCGNSFIRGACMCPGDASSQSPYRSELVGLLLYSCFLKGFSLLLTHKAMSTHRMSIGCDGKSALSKSFSLPTERISTNDPQFDVIAAIHGMWKNLPVKPWPIHVHGHQDEDVPFERLPRLAKMNVVVDQMAKTCVQAAANSSFRPAASVYSYGMPTVIFRGQTITSNLSSTILATLSEERARSYWCKKLRIDRVQDTPLNDNLISWTSFKRGFGKLSKPQRPTIVRWLSRQLQLNSSKRKHGNSLRCFRCGSLSNNLEHCVRCKHSRNLVNIHIAGIKELLLKYDTEPSLLAAIPHMLSSWLTLSGSPFPVIHELQEPARSCFYAQLSLGLFNFVQGIHHKSFFLAQQSHYSISNSSKSALKWHGALIHALWLMLIDVYDQRTDDVSALQSTDNPSHPAFLPARVAAIAELQQGLDSLPTFYHQYFKHTEESLRSLGPRALSQWLRVVRLGRERHGGAQDPPDNFSPGGTFRDWLGA